MRAWTDEQKCSILRRQPGYSPGLFPDESVDLIYLDPPFNSSRNYNVLFRDSNGTEPPAQIRAFEDSWTWDQEAVETLEDLTRTAPASLSGVWIIF